MLRLEHVSSDYPSPKYIKKSKQVTWSNIDSNVSDSLTIITISMINKVTLPLLR